MKENKIKKLQERLETLHVIQDARLACNADDLDIREEIAEVEEEIKELQDDINEKNNNGNDTNVGSIENSIEEDIKNAEHFIKSIKTDKEYKEENGWHGYCNKEIVELARILEHILSDYKRVLKENEEKTTILLAGAEKVKQLEKENEELEEKVEKQEDIIKNALYIINKNEKEKIDRTWLYNFDKCAILKGDNK